MNTAELQLRDAKLGAAINNAVAILPAEYLLSIKIQALSVELVLQCPDGSLNSNFTTCDTIDEDINDWVRSAVSDDRTERERKL